MHPCNGMYERVQTHIKNIMSMHAFNGWYNSNNDNNKCKGRCNTINVHLIISIYRQRERETGNSLDLITAKYIHSNWKWTQLSDKSFVNEQMCECVECAFCIEQTSLMQTGKRFSHSLLHHHTCYVETKKKPPSAFSLLPKIIWRTWSSLSLYRSH